MRFRISVNTVKYDRKPDKKEMAKMSTVIAGCATTMTLKSFSKALKDGRAWTGLFRRSRKVAANWIGQQVWAADIDEGNKSLEDLLELAERSVIKPAIIHETFSSKPGERKWRVIAICEDFMEDYAFAKAIATYITDCYGGDPACKDLSRMFQGTSFDKRMWVSPDGDKSFFKNLVVEEKVIMENLKIGHDSVQKIVEKLPSNDERSRLNSNQWRRTKGLFKQQSVNLRRGIPSRYQAIWRTACLMTQLGFLSEEFIRKTILWEIDGLDLYKSYDKDPDDIISTAITWGMKHVWEESEDDQ